VTRATSRRGTRRLSGSQPRLAQAQHGEDFPVDGRWIGMTPSGSGMRINLGGYAGPTVGWVEGIEVNILGAVAGVDAPKIGPPFQQ
jgi:hypothetical protein